MQNRKNIISLLIIGLSLLGLAGIACGQSEEEGVKFLKLGRQAKLDGKYQEALDYFQKSFDVHTKLDDPFAIAVSLASIGEVYSEQGAYEQALNYLKEALAIFRFLKEPKQISILLNDIGTVYDKDNQLPLALKYYEESLAIFKQLNLPEEMAPFMINIAGVYSAQGNYIQALKTLEEALMIARQYNHPLEIAESLNSIGADYIEQGAYEQALNYLEEALAIFKQMDLPDGILRSLTNIGSTYYAQGDFAEALEYFEEALVISRQMDSEHTPSILEHIGNLHLSRQQYEIAEKAFLLAIAEDKKKGHSRRGNPNLVELYLLTSRPQEALKLLSEITPGWSATIPYQIQFHTQNGLALQGLNNFKNASYDFLKAVTLAENLRPKATERTGFLGARVRIHAYQGLIVSLVERLIQGEKSDRTFAAYGKNLAENAFYFAEATKARTLIEAMAASGRRAQKLELPPDLREQEESLLSQLAAIEKNWETQYRNGEEAFKEWMARRDDLKQQFDALLARLRQEQPHYAALYYPRPLLPENLPLQPNEVLLEYALGADASYLFEVRPGGKVTIFKIPVGKEALEKMAQEFHDSVSSSNFSEELGQELYRLLLGYALKDADADTHCIVVPDGMLGLIPFDALVIQPGKNVAQHVYAGDRYRFSYAQSATVLALLRQLPPSQARRPLFALGDPVYAEEDPRYLAYKQGKPQPMLVASAQDADHAVYRALPTRLAYGEEILYNRLQDTTPEVEEIARLFGVAPQPPDVLLNVSANETMFRQAPLSTYRYLHFATHADVMGGNQDVNQPFILLGRVENAPDDDGFLTLTEVLDLELDADIVTLSACLTGYGKVVAGEGISNFARAFHHAGARNVIVSLWPIASAPAAEYMQLFYRNLKPSKGKNAVSPAEALRLAKAAMKKKYPDPAIWAMFIVHGAN